MVVRGRLTLARHSAPIHLRAPIGPLQQDLCFTLSEEPHNTCHYMTIILSERCSRGPLILDIYRSICGTVQ